MFISPCNKCLQTCRGTWFTTNVPRRSGIQIQHTQLCCHPRHLLLLTILVISLVLWTSQFLAYYIRRGRRLPPLFPHALWDMHTLQDDLPRTNNNLEGWHNRFSSMFTHSHTSICNFIEILMWDSFHKHMATAQMLVHVALRSKQHIQTLVQGCNIANAIPFLREISYN